MLALENVEVVYDEVLLALKGVSLHVPERSIVALLGANGAGKTTLLRACTGLLPIRRGAVTRGKITLGEHRLEQMAAPDIVRAGVSQVPEGRQIFAELTVEENLRVGAHTARGRLDERFERVYELFPLLRARRGRTGGYLSGGEQQMLAIARALMPAPRFLLLDEPSMGLAPQVRQQLRELLLEINRDGTAILLVEQNAALALSLAERGYVLQGGKVVLEGAAETLREHEDMKDFYLGLRSDGRARSYLQVKHYRRRKHWVA